MAASDETAAAAALRFPGHYVVLSEGVDLDLFRPGRKRRTIVLEWRPTERPLARSVLRALEEEGLVRSEWQSDAPGPARRSYELTETGSRLLGTWAEALRSTHRVIGAFLERYERGKEVN